MVTAGGLIQTSLGRGCGFGVPVDESLRVLAPGEAKGLFAFLQDSVGSTVVDVMRGEHRDPGMSMLGVVPGEERTAEGGCGRDVVEPPGEAGVVLQGLELRLGEGVVVTDLGTAERAGHPEVGQQLRGALAGHRCPAIRMQRQRLGFDALLEAGLLDEPCSQRRALPFGDHPPDHISAEDVEQHVQVKVRPAFWSQKARDVPRPGFVRCGRDQLGLGVARVSELISSFAHRLARGQNPIHRAFRAKVLPFVQKRRDDLGRGAVNEARRGKRLQDVFSFALAQGPGRRGTGLLVPGSGPVTTVEGRPRHAQRPARRRHADLQCERLGRHQQSFPLFRFSPSSPDIFDCTSRIVCAVASSFSRRATFASSWRTLGMRGLCSAGFAPRLFAVRP